MLRVLVINGTVGVGKTTTADRVGRLWRAAGVPGALIDVDHLRDGWPAPADDPFNARLGLAGLSALARVHVEHGARALVLADVLEDRAAREAQRAAFIAASPDLDHRVVRLRGDVEAIRARLPPRHRDDPDDGASLAWHLRRVGELHDILDRSRPDDVVVQVDGLSPEQVADAVLAAVGWDEIGPA